MSTPSHCGGPLSVPRLTRRLRRIRTQADSSLPPHPRFSLESLRLAQFARLHLEMIGLGKVRFGFPLHVRVAKQSAHRALHLALAT